jgi:hypothetical protein
MALTILKLGSVVVTTAALGAATAWAARRAKFEHTIDRFTDQVAFLESDEADHHDAISRHVTAATLLHPGGVTREQLRNQLIYGGVDRRAMATAIHSLVSGGVLEKITVESAPLVRPTENFMLALLHEPEKAPRLLSATRMLAGPGETFEYEDLRLYVPSADVLDDSPLGQPNDSS